MLLGTAGLFYGITATALSLLFIVSALRVWQHNDDRRARQMFGYSVLYLFLIFAVLVVDRTVGLPGLPS